LAGVVQSSGRALVKAGCRTAGGCTAAAARAVFAAGEQRNVEDNYLGLVALLSRLLVVPTAGLELALDVKLGAFLDVIANDFGVALEGDQVVPLGAILPVALLILKAVAGSQPKAGYDGTAWGGTDFGVLAYVS
jgi:hypothetical protein